MPIYEFQCADCGEKKEILFRSNDEKVEMKCKKCGSKNLHRVLSSTSISISGESDVGAPSGASSAHNCSGGSCATYDIPGPR